MDCQDVNFDHHQHYLNTRRMARKIAAERDAQSKPNKRMTGLELDKLLNELLAPLGITVKAVTKSSYMPATGVIMTPKGRRRGDIKDNPLKKANSSRDIQSKELKKTSGQEEVN